MLKLIKFLFTPAYELLHSVRGLEMSRTLPFEFRLRQQTCIWMLFLSICIVFSCLLLLLVNISHSVTNGKYSIESPRNLPPNINRICHYLKFTEDFKIADFQQKANVEDQMTKEERLIPMKISKTKREMTEDLGHRHEADLRSGFSGSWSEKHVRSLNLPSRSTIQRSWEGLIPNVSSLLATVFKNRPSISERRFMAIVLQMEVIPEDTIVDNYSAFFTKLTNKSNVIMPRLLIGQDMGCDQHPPFLLVLVPSVASHVGTRQAIRDTWASPAYPRFQSWPGEISIMEKVKVVFVFGVTNSTDDVLQLRGEQERYKDIVQYDFVDTYRNLTVKMAAAFRWTRQFCPLAKFVLKVDEDTMVNVPVLIRLLHVLSARSARFILGHAIRDATPLRRGRWQVTQKQYPYSKYPPYMAGHSYVLTANVVDQIAAEILRMTPNQLLPMEDAFFTGLLASHLHVRRLHSPAMAGTQTRVGLCRIVQDSYLSLTHFSAQSMLGVWGHARRGLCGTMVAPPAKEEMSADVGE